MYLFDTTVVSELRRRDRADAAVLAWAVPVLEEAVFLSVITLWEIEQGVLARERRDKKAGAVLRRWIDSEIRPSFAGRILIIDEPVALTCARLHVPDPRPERDSLIAATALVHGLTVVTRNTRDFAPMGVPVLDPWNPA